MSGAVKQQRKRRPRIKPKGICCIEAIDRERLHGGTSVLPALQLLAQWDPYDIPYAYRDVITRAEFEAYIAKWCQAGNQSRFPILYLAMHGDPDTLYIGHGRKHDNIISLDDLEQLLEGKCKQRLIHFGSCATVDVHGSRLNRFLRTTGALAVSGYREQVSWLDSMAFELIAFGAMQMNALTKSGAGAMKRRIVSNAGGMAKRLGFRMVVSK